MGGGALAQPPTVTVGNSGSPYIGDCVPMNYRLPATPDRNLGQGLAEYALILALIAIVAIVALIFLGGSVSKILSGVGVSV